MHGGLCSLWGLICQGALLLCCFREHLHIKFNTHICPSFGIRISPWPPTSPLSRLPPAVLCCAAE